MSSILIRRANMVSGGSGPTPPVDYSTRYLTFEALEAGTFSLAIPAGITSSYLTSVSYSLDNGDTWVTTQNDSSDITITTPAIQAGGKVLWKGDALCYGTGTSNYCHFSSSGSYNASGNIMSLLYGDSFINKVALSNSYTFAYLFNANTGLVSAENLILPATTLSTACYRNMFYQCSALTTAPALPATTLTASCYRTMFYQCRSLSYIKCLATNISASACTTSWVTTVAALGTFVKNPNMSGWTTGNSGIPSGWTVEDAQ